MRAVNLLPKDGARRSGPRRSANPVALVGVVGGAVVLTAISCLFVLARSDVAQKRDELAAKQAELGVTPEPPPPPSGTEATLADARMQRAQALTAALKLRIAWDRVLRQFAVVLPEDVWLISINAKAPTSPATMMPAASPGSPPLGFKIDGYTYSHAAVARLLARLQVIPELTRVTLETSERTVLGAREIVRFTIVADVRPGGKVA